MLLSFFALSAFAFSLFGSSLDGFLDMLLLLDPVPALLDPLVSAKLFGVDQFELIAVPAQFLPHPAGLFGLVFGDFHDLETLREVAE